MWKTAITKIDGGKILIQGYNLLELMEFCSFGDLVLLMITGKMPYLHQGKLMEAILVSCCDEGPFPPATNASRFIASCGVPLQASVAAGMLGFGEHDVGAIESCAKLLQEKVALIEKGKIDNVSADIIFDFASRNKRIPGFGHANFDSDPRARKLIQIACEKIYPHTHIDLLLAIEERLIREKGDHLAANINGAVAATISDLDINWRFGDGIFILSRSLGLVVHALEEMKLGNPYKKISINDIEYIGPEEKQLPLRIEP